MTKVLFKIITLMVTISILFSVFTACDSKTKTDQEKTTTESVKTEESTAETKQETAAVSFMTWESPDMNDKIFNSLKKFEEENPDIKTNLIPTPQKDYGLKIREMLAAKQAPDIFMVGNDMALIFGKDELVLDLKPFVDKDNELASGFYPGVIENWYAGGKLYGLPGLLNCYGVFYNKKLFQDKSVPLPTKEWTYDQMFDAAEKLKNTEQKMYGLYNAAPDPFFLSVYAAAAEGAPFTDKIFPISKVEASDKFKEGIEKFAKYIKSGAVVPRGYNVDNLTGLFMQGKVPMMMYGQWAVDELIRNAPKDLEWGYAPNPGMTKQSVIYDAVGWSVSGSTKNPEATFKVLKYIDTKTYEAVLPATPVAPPAYQASAAPYYNKLKESGHGDVAETLDYILTSPDKQPVRFMDPWADKAWKFINAGWDNIINGKTPVAEVDKMIKGINDVIQSESK